MLFSQTLLAITGSSELVLLPVLKQNSALIPAHVSEEHNTDFALMALDELQL